MNNVITMVDDLQIMSLSRSDLKNPVDVFKKFAADFPLLSIKQLLSAMIDLCVVAEDIHAEKTEARQPLFDLSTRLAQLIEAVYVLTKKDTKYLTKLIGGMAKPQNVRLLKVCERPGTVGSYPMLMLSGQWLYDAGFHIGHEVGVIIEAEKLTIAINEHWTRDERKWWERA